MIVLDGKSVFGGIAIGKIALFEKGDDPVKRRTIEDTNEEIKRFENAKEKAKEELKALYEKALLQIEGATEKDMQYISQKAQKIIEKIDEIDTLINEHTTGWKTGRMNKVDLTILRLAVYEMKWDEDVPTGVAINEAVNLAKKYSSEDGASFVNGVLAKLAD